MLQDVLVTMLLINRSDKCFVNQVALKGGYGQNQSPNFLSLKIECLIR
jgi:hypothetical protein